MTMSHVKKGDTVIVISGVHKGKRGKIINMIKSSGRVRVEGICLIKRHTKKSQQLPQGAIVEKEGTIHGSNVMRAVAFDRKAVRTGVDDDKS